MIARLIEKIIENIKSEFSEISEGAILKEAIEKPKEADMPLIAIYPEEFRIEPAPEKSAVSYNGQAKTKSANLAFDNRLFIDIYGKNLAEAEKWTSLIISFIILEEEMLIGTCNKEKEENPYKAGNFKSVQSFEKITPIKSEFASIDNISKSRMEFNVTGRLSLFETKEEERYKIKEISLSV